MSDWNASDERLFQELARKREEIRGRQMDRVRKVAGHFISVADGATVAERMIKHADEIRDALEPFDSGARVKEQADG